VFALVSRLAPLSPHLPKLIDKGVVREEHRIVGRRGQESHVTADKVVHAAVQDFK